MYKKCILFFVITALFFVSSCGRQDANKENDETKPVIRIAYLPIIHSVPILVQSEMIKNLEEDYTLELVKFSSWPELVDALRLNKVDGASMIFELALKASQNTKELKIVSLSHRNGNVLVGASNINSISDLKGKTVAITHKLSPHNTLLHILLDKEHMNYDDLNVVELAPAEMPSSLASGALSAYLAAEPYGSICISNKIGKILTTSNEIYPNSVCCVMVFHKNFLDKDPKVTEQFLADFAKAAERAEEKDHFVVSAFKKHSNLKEDMLLDALQLTSYTNLNLGKEEYNQIVEKIKHYNILDYVPEYEDIYYSETHGD